MLFWSPQDILVYNKYIPCMKYNFRQLQNTWNDLFSIIFLGSTFRNYALRRFHCRSCITHFRFYIPILYSKYVASIKRSVQFIKMSIALTSLLQCENLYNSQQGRLSSDLKNVRTIAVANDIVGRIPATIIIQVLIIVYLE